MNRRSAGSGFLSGARSLLLMVPFCLQGSCGSSDSGTLVIVDLSGQPMDLQSIQVTPILDGKPAKNVETFPGSQARFGLQFAPGTVGPLKLNIEGLLSNRCVSASGEGSTVLSGQPQIELGVTLAPVLPLLCNGQTQPTLAVSKLGDGGGTVTSMPGGISCGATCSATFQSGQSVTLSAQPDPGSVFAGWSGACTGTNPTGCQVTVNDLVAVRATFNKQVITGPGWPQRFGGTGTSATSVYDLALDSAGNVLIMGVFGGTVDFGGGLLTSATSYDLFMAKYKPDGTHLWSKRYTGTDYQYFSCVKVDASGDVYVSGVIQGSTDLGGGVLTSAGIDDGVLAKYRGTDGGHVWSKRWGGVSGDGFGGIALDSNGNLFAVGRFYQTVDFGGGGLTSAGFNDIALAKYKTADGSHVWSKRFGGTGIDQGTAVAVDSSGDAYITGLFQNTVDFGGGPLTAMGMLDVYVARFAGANGNHVWSKSFGATGSYSLPYRVAVDNAGSTFVTGKFQGTVNFGGGGVTSGGGYDGFVARYRASDGGYVWAKRFGSTSEDEAWAVTPDGSGNVLISGYFTGTVDPGGGALTSAGMTDLLLARYKITDGSFVGAKRFGGSKSENALSVVMDGSGSAFVSGNFQDTMDFGGKQLTATGQGDGFVMKIPPP